MRKVLQMMKWIFGATLYNTLNLLLELRLVIGLRLQGGMRYRAGVTGGRCLQVCTVCGRVAEIRSPEVAVAVDRLHLRRFHKDGYSLYVYGVCSACQAKLTRKKSNETKKQKSQKDNTNSRLQG